MGWKALRNPQTTRKMEIINLCLTSSCSEVVLVTWTIAVRYCMGGSLAGGCGRGDGISREARAGC